jgi:predicted Rossmann-fold nucleotide-binding protein
MIHDADMIILLNGRIGTLSEFTIALEEGKRVAVLTQTGGIADNLEYILSVAQKEFPGQIFFSDDPCKIIELLKKTTLQTP